MGPGSDPESSLLTRFDADPPAAEISRSSLRPCALAAAATVALLLVALLVAAGQWAPQSVPPISRAVSAKSAGPCVPPICRGVSTKSAGPVLRSETDPYPWTNAMLDWQRTVFHFQPQKNWMNDPNAPLYYEGWYHLFYQYNPHSAVWGTGNLSWGHAVSRDLVHWRHLPLAMVPDHLYDANGVWSGSATLLPRGGPHRAHIVILYTGITTDWAQVQNLAEPADPSDPLLLNWAKSDFNPVLLPSPGIEPRNFRDPSTAWPVGARSAWRVAIGSMNGLLVYETKDFHSYELLPGQLHAVAGTGMWECIDFYPIPTREGVKHVLKASLYDHNKDYYAIGVYDVDRDVWVPDDVDADVGMGLMVDYGKYYASKTFYDEVKQRRVLLGWINETDSQRTDLLKGWASVQAIPRTVMYDERTRHNLLLWPVEEVESLRLSSREFSNITLGPGLVMPLDVHEAGQVDITAEFEIESSARAQIIEVDDGYNCNSSGGAAGRGALGPFGLLVLADEDRTEQTAVYFYVGRGSDGGLRTFFCQDELRRELCFVSVLVCTFGDVSSVKLRVYNYFIYCRSSEANDLTKNVYGSTVPVLNGENLSVRVLIDHSIVESFAQGGRTCVSSRVYPTKAIYGAARVFLFNNATGAQVTAKSVEIWQMNSASIGPYTPQVL